MIVEGNATFTKPAVPPEATIAHKLADEMLRTGESTNELIALGDTPVTRPRTRSATKKASHGRKKAVTEPSEGESQRSVTC